MQRKGPARDRNKERFWRGILREYRRSGLKVREFCQSRDLSEPSFYAWRREVERRDRTLADVRERTRKALPPAGRAARAERSPPAKPSRGAATFLPVRLSAGPATTPESAGVECLLPSGAVLRCPPGMEPAIVAALVRAWEQGRC